MARNIGHVPTVRSSVRLTLLAAAFTAILCSPALAQSSEKQVPVFPDLEFVGSEGGSIRLSELKGNIVLLNVWATWCGPCKKELPIVQKMYDTYSDRNFVVVAVNVDADRKRVSPFLQQFNISIPVYYAAPEDAGPLTAMGIPSTFILGTDRTLIDRYVGYSPDVEDRWKKLLDRSLKARK
jgi:thiol-disulfide isomerase/thioredoxin